MKLIFLDKKKSNSKQIFGPTRVSPKGPGSPHHAKFLDVLVELRSKLEIAESTIQEKEALLNDIHQEFEFFKKESRETQRKVSIFRAKSLFLSTSDKRTEPETHKV